MLVRHYWQGLGRMVSVEVPPSTRARHGIHSNGGAMPCVHGPCHARPIRYQVPGELLVAGGRVGLHLRQGRLLGGRMGDGNWVCVSIRPRL